MGYNFTKLSDVPVVTEFPAGANAIIETNGEIKRCPSAGGSGGASGDDYITLHLRRDGSKVVLNELQMPVIADKTVDEVMTEVNAGKKRVKIYMEGEPEPIIMNLSAINPALSFSLLVGGEEFGS